MSSLLHPHSRARIVERIMGVRPDSPRRWGRMTPHGMICHLSDAFAGCLGARPVAARSSLADRTLIRFIAVTLPVRWPKGVPTLREADQERDGTPPGDFQTDLLRLGGDIDDFVTRLDAQTMRHPMFGRMTEGEWGRWGYRHIDHHARQFNL